MTASRAAIMSAHRLVAVRALVSATESFGPASDLTGLDLGKEMNDERGAIGICLEPAAAMRHGLDGKNVPSRFGAKIAEYVEGYELYDRVPV